MVQAKPDTSSGFRPPIPQGADLTGPALAAIRFDGALDRTVLSPQLHQVLLGMARVRNAVSSFRLEGEHVELDRAREVLDSGRPDSPVELGVLKLARAYRKVAENRLPDFTVEGIEAAHQKLFNGVLEPELVGRLKSRPNTITDITGRILRFVPTPPARVRPELESLLAWLEDSSSEWPPLTASIFFAEFEAIHPFVDGNGRLGRYLNLALLRKLGLHNSALIPLDTRFFRTSDRYYESLATTNSGREYRHWSRYYLRELVKAYEVASRRGDLGATIARFPRPSTRAVLAWVLQGSGDWFRRGDFPNQPGYSGPALWHSFQELVGAGVLEAAGQAKGRRYRIRSGFLADVYARLR